MIKTQLISHVATRSEVNTGAFSSGYYDTVKNQIEITNIYGNEAITRASIGAWGCGLCIGIAGGIWSTAAGMVSAGAGFLVGLSYTAMAIAMCSD